VNSVGVICATPKSQNSTSPCDQSTPLEPPRRLTGRYIARWIEENYSPYQGNASFLSGPTDRTLKLNQQVQELLEKEQEKGILDVDLSTPSGVDVFGPGYLDRDLEAVVGLQTDSPLKRSINPRSGYHQLQEALKSHNYTPDPILEKVFTKYCKTVNSGVMSTYTEEMLDVKKSGLLTGLPDSYGRGRIVGDYRRVALFGVDRLIEAKKKDLASILDPIDLDERSIQLREEVSDQISALQELKSMSRSYGFDLSKPASNSQEAVQWVYFGFLAAIKEQVGAAMSFGRMDAFFDIYFELDLQRGVLTESQVQELVDHLLLKLRLVRHLRSSEFEALFPGDPTWTTCVLAGLDSNGGSMVTKTSFRFLQSLYNLGPAPEPNLVIAWSPKLGNYFKEYCVRISMKWNCVQYGSDEIMRPRFGSDYSIASGISALKTGRDMQFFGASVNLPKLLLFTLNQGRDELTGAQVGPLFPEPEMKDGALDYESLILCFDEAMDWICELYVKTLNVVHSMHDKYNYERVEMALHDTIVRRLMAFGIAGLSVLTDSLSASKYAKVIPIRNENGLTSDFLIEGQFPNFGNDDSRVDEIAHWIVSTFHEKLSQKYTYRNSIPTLSVALGLIYGKLTGSTPDGRPGGYPFTPGAIPLHKRDSSGALASLNSIISIPYDACLDGILNTFNIDPKALGQDLDVQIQTLTGLLDGYVLQGGHHLMVNVLDKEKLLDAIEHPERHRDLIVGVSDYSVYFTQLTQEQQLEFISRTFHDTI